MQCQTVSSAKTFNNRRKYFVREREQICRIQLPQKILKTSAPENGKQS